MNDCIVQHSSDSSERKREYVLFLSDESIFCFYLIFDLVHTIGSKIVNDVDFARFFK